MKIILIQPPISGSPEALSESLVEPLGLAYIAGFLEEKGYFVRILDCPAEGIEGEGIREYLRKIEPDIVGISCMFSAYYQDSLYVAEIVKKEFPKTLVVLGGVHATVFPESLLRNTCVDIVVMGEGEGTFLEIVKKVETGSSLKEIPGTAIRIDGKIIKNPSSPLIEDLDTLPFPARHLLPIKKYFSFQKKGVGTYKYYLRNPLSPLITSRGCPFNCSFCAVPNFWKRIYRTHTPERVISEIEALLRDYKIREIAFWDDNISLDRERFIKLCTLIKERKFNLSWQTPNGISTLNLDYSLLNLMKESGYYRATFAIESGSVQTLKKYVDKPIDFKKVKELIKICHYLGIWTYGIFIIGFPDEKLNQIEETKRMVKSLGFDFVAIFIAQPYPGTRLFEIFKEKGLIPGNDYPQGSSMVFSKFDTLYFSHRKLWKIQQDIYFEFILSKFFSFLKMNSFVFLFKKINSWEKFRYFLRLLGNILKRKWFGRKV